MADQIYGRLEFLRLCWVGGIPDGATLLGEEVRKEMGSPRHAELAKIDGRITLISQIPPDESLLLVEDFFTRGTGFKEAAENAIKDQPGIFIIPVDPVIINRGGLKKFEVEGLGSVSVVAIAERKVNDWESADCPLCKMGSVPIKPKITDENWQRLIASQLPK